MAAETLSDTAAMHLATLARAAFDAAFVGVIALAAVLVLSAALGIWRRAGEG